MASLEISPCEGLWTCCKAEYGMNDAMRTVVQQVTTQSRYCLILLSDFNLILMFSTVLKILSKKIPRKSVRSEPRR